MKDMYKVQKEAKEIQKQLATIHVEAEIDGVIALVSAEQEIISVTIPDEMMKAENKAKLSKAIVAAINKAMKKAKEIAAEKMKGIMGSMGFGG